MQMLKPVKSAITLQADSLFIQTDAVSSFLAVMYV